MSLEVANERATPCHGRFFGGDARAGGPESRQESVVEFVHERAVVGLHEREGGEVATAYVLRDGGGRAPRPAGTTKGSLRATEEALKLVGVRRDARVVETDEEVLLVALGQCGEVIDEVAGRGAKAVARGLGAQLRDVGVEACLRLGGVLRAIESLGIRRDLVRDAS